VRLAGDASIVVIMSPKINAVQRDLGPLRIGMKNAAAVVGVRLSFHKSAPLLRARDASPMGYLGRARMNICFPTGFQGRAR
jgi:hypothetical protein